MQGAATGATVTGLALSRPYRWIAMALCLGCSAICHLSGGGARKGINKASESFFPKFLYITFFSVFLFRLKDFACFDCRLGFSRPNYIYYQLERSGGQEYGENASNGLNNQFHGGCFSYKPWSKRTKYYFRPQVGLLRHLLSIYSTYDVRRSA